MQREHLEGIVYPNEVVVSTKEYGTVSGLMGFKVSHGVAMVRPLIYSDWLDIDSKTSWGSTKELARSVDTWYNNGDLPRDEEGRVIPFPLG